MTPPRLVMRGMEQVVQSCYAVAMRKFRALLRSILQSFGAGRDPQPRRIETEPHEMRDALDSIDHKTFDWLARAKAACDGAVGTGSHG